MILGCKDINKTLGVNLILEKITFHIEDKEKVAIVGVNGAGKTTLFRILTGEIREDFGELFRKKDASVGYLAQNTDIDETRTIYEEMRLVFKHLQKMESDLREMENKMGCLAGQELSDNMELYSELQHKFEQNDGYSYESRIRGVIKGLGFSENDGIKPITTLSGGQKTRVYLGKLLLSQPDILLLDEPTNHLDIDSLQWLEDFLRNYDGAILVISHDRYFLDRIVTKVVEIEHKKSNLFEGNYTFYSTQKEINREIQEKAFSTQQKEIHHQEEVIKTLRSFNREKSIKRAESREKMLNKIDKLDKPENAPNKMRLTLTPKIMSGNDVLHSENLSKSFGELKLFSNVSFDIKRGDKVAIIGANGVGKSTLFKILLAQIEQDTGIIRFGTNVHVGYYDQAQQSLDESKSIFSEIADTYPTMPNSQIRTILAAFVFMGDDIYKPISALSGGEKGRVALAKIMLSNANLLMLDEPTNHLDMYSKEILEDAINRYEGTVLYISHDRYFINKTAEKVLELTPKAFIEYLGDYDYYLEKKAELARENAELLKLLPPADELSPVSDTKVDWLRQKEIQAQERKIYGMISKLENEIETTECKIQELDNLLFDNNISSDSNKVHEIFEKKIKLEEELEKLYEQWETLQ